MPGIFITDGHFKRLCSQLAKHCEPKMDHPKETVSREALDNLAGAFLKRVGHVLSRRTPTQSKDEMKRLAKASERFMQALSDIDPIIWPNLYGHIEDPPQRLNQAITHLLSNERDALGGDAKRAAERAAVSHHFRNVEELGRVAWQTHGRVTSSRRARKTFAEARWLALQLVPIFEGATGQSATADYNEHKHKFDGVDTPFVRFVAMFIQGLAKREKGKVRPGYWDRLKELYEPGLGPAIKNQFRKPVSKKK